MDGYGIGVIAFCGKDGHGLGKPTTLAKEGYGISKEGWDGSLKEGWDDFSLLEVLSW
ncbi:HNH family homing endonuclease [Acinetobacter phage BS46]|nr:HNH family homing endonuclease [Acinetobacter phage BS46]